MLLCGVMVCLCGERRCLHAFVWFGGVAVWREALSKCFCVVWWCGIISNLECILFCCGNIKKTKKK